MTCLVENYQQIWAETMLKLLREIYQAALAAKDLEQVALSAVQLTDFQNRYGQIVTEGLLANPPPEPSAEQARRSGRVKHTLRKNLLDRLRDHPDKVLAFMQAFYQVRSYFQLRVKMDSLSSMPSTWL